MTSAPVADQLRLLEVQALDTRAAQIAHQRAGHPSRAALEQIGARLAELEEQRVATQTAVTDIRRDLKKAEADVEQVRSRAKRDQARVQSGGVTVKDVQALSSELEVLALRQAHLEDVELEVMERLEQQEATLAEATAARDEVLVQREQAGAELTQLLVELDAEAAQVAADRVNRAEGLDAGLVALYDRVRKHMGGVGVAVLRGHRCEGCRLELNSNEVAQIMAAPADEVIRCEECTRILVRGAGEAR